MSDKFTSGPWKMERTGDGKRYIIGDGQSSWGTHVAEVYADDTDSDEAQANAKMIAAAPELLAACRDAIESFEQHGYPDGCVERALLKAAIAKATGEEITAPAAPDDESGLDKFDQY